MSLKNVRVYYNVPVLIIPILLMVMRAHLFDSRMSSKPTSGVLAFAINGEEVNATAAELLQQKNETMNKINKLVKRKTTVEKRLIQKINRHNDIQRKLQHLREQLDQHESELKKVNEQKKILLHTYKHKEAKLIRLLNKETLLP